MSGVIDTTRLRLVDWFRGTRAVSLLDSYLASQWHPYDGILDEQWRKLQGLLQHAYNHVPFYQQWFDQHGVSPDDIRTWADFRRLPLLGKTAVRAAGEQMLARNRKRFHPHLKKTGGSTGEPLTYYMDRASRSAQWAHIYRLWCNAGWRPGEPMVMLGGTSLYPSAAAVKKWFYVRLNNWLLLSAFGMGDEQMRAWLPRLRRFKARFMHAYASSAYLLAQFVEANSPADIRFDAVFTTAEVLQPRHRETIERAFGCRVYDFYGAAYGGGFAFECDRQMGLHCVSESCFMEVVRPDGTPAPPGEIGEIVVTDLNNYAMPFIRYKPGDQGTFADRACSCGRGLPLLATVVGRSPDFIESRSGERYHEEFFSYLFKEIPWICQFCVEQISPDHIQVLLKPDRPPVSAELNHLRRYLARTFDGSRLEVRVADELPISANGKFKYIINHVAGSESAGDG